MKAYFCVYDDYENTGEAFIAENAKEARQMAWRHGDHDKAYIDIRVNLIKPADTDGLPKGPVKGTVDSIKRGIYISAEDNCPECGRDTTLSFCEDYEKVMCSACEQKHYEQWLKEKNT